MQTKFQGKQDNDQKEKAHDVSMWLEIYAEEVLPEASTPEAQLRAEHKNEEEEQPMKNVATNREQPTQYVVTKQTRNDRPTQEHNRNLKAIVQLAYSLTKNVIEKEVWKRKQTKTNKRSVNGMLYRSYKRRKIEKRYILIERTKQTLEKEVWIMSKRKREKEKKETQTKEKGIKTERRETKERKQSCGKWQKERENKVLQKRNVPEHNVSK